MVVVRKATIREITKIQEVMEKMAVPPEMKIMGQMEMVIMVKRTGRDLRQVITRVK